MSKLSPSEKRDRIWAVGKAAKAFPFRSTPAWKTLADLSKDTRFQGAFVDPSAIIVDEDDTFEGTMTVSVLLSFEDRAGDRGFKSGEAFPADFKGHFENGEPVIDEMDVDTRSFYAGMDLVR